MKKFIYSYVHYISMVRSNTRDYEKQDVLKVLNLIYEEEPVNLNDIVFSLGPKIDDDVEQAIKTLIDKEIIGSRNSFLKTHVNFNPWDTITYDGIADNYIGVNSDKMLYLKDKTHNEYNISTDKMKINKK